MPTRQKILILENDDFLREIIGNLLHKKGAFILNGDTIKNGLTDVRKQHIHTVILGTSCPDFNGKSTISHLKKILHPSINIFVLNNEKQELSYHPKKDQMLIKNLSLNTLLNAITI